MKLSRDEVQRVALLARLRLTASEEEQLAEQLGAILEYMEQLNQLDITGVEPFSHANDAVTALREDKEVNQPNADALLANAPERDGSFFKVPKIIE
ncbi:MAG: Asp-tRNA(Asn)/Glu-tRNA(Gln) amidotransferase subunit GatC [Deltaproteobacteria bacterium]|nr:Asp-tRNA(Asn)/Glu-tRNA(Gln) amidotransferase subunit GatC [Deltaproteobacteria bacterium]